MSQQQGKPEAQPAQPGRLKRLTRKAWWLHSFGALSFGVGVMIFARKGLVYADKIMMVLGLSWLLMFVALRFIVGPANRSPDEVFVRKGVRLVTNYVIKQLYQQMFFFLAPLYAASATWSFASYNWWLPPLLLVCGVVSTIDLIFDNVIMERRVVASLMYGLALFGVLNVMLPIFLGWGHFVSLLVAAGTTAPAVALLTFRVGTVFSPAGIGWTLAATGLLIGGAWVGRAAVPPAPLALAHGAVGFGTIGSRECVPSRRTVVPASEITDNLRCGSLVTEPGGVRDEIVHRWYHEGQLIDSTMERVEGCDDEGQVDRSFPQRQSLPEDPSGSWVCSVETADRQLVGMMRFEVKGEMKSEGESGEREPAAPSDGGAAPGPAAADGGSVVIVPDGGGPEIPAMGNGVTDGGQ